MNNFILRALVRVNVLLTHPSSRGRRRACPAASTPRTPVPAPRTTAVRPPRWLLDDFFAPLVGEEHDLVRPYVALYEREQERRHQERLTTALRMPSVRPGLAW